MIENILGLAQWRSRVQEFEPQPGHIICVDIDHVIISRAIIPILLIQEEQLSITGGSM